MKYTLTSQENKNSLRLQGIGLVLGTPASEIKKGDSIMWNYGEIEHVNSIVKETAKTLVISILYKDSLYERKLNKKRLVCILKK